MQRAFVTGGSGFLGRTLVSELRRRNVDVRALARSKSSAATVAAAGAEPIHGDLDDLHALRTGMRGCDVVFHAAAIVDEWGPATLFDRVNVVGTENVLAAAQDAGVRRFVHVSTEAVLAGSAPLVHVDETFPRPAAPYGRYARTKGLAEERVVAANRGGFSTVVIRPRFVWGKGDTSVLPKVVAAVRAGTFRWIDGGRYLTSATHVRNACEGLMLAAERGRGGEIYFVTDGPPVEFRKFLTALLETQHANPGHRSLPRRLAQAIAVSAEAIWTALRLQTRPPATRLSVKMMGEEVTLNDAKARRELSYLGCVTFEDGVRDMTDSAPISASS
jgi:nucleoside-diphosphate-sugar epimerase